MTNPAPPSLSLKARAYLRLYIMLAISLALHLIVMQVVEFGAVERGRPPPGALEVRLAPAAAGPAAQPVLLKSIDRVARTEVQDWTPPPTPAPPQPAASAAPQAAAEAYRPGMSREAAGATHIDAPLPMDPTYYPSRDVDEHPVLISGGKPVYPAAASLSNVRGEVLVLFMLNENGMVEEASVIEAKPPNQGFEQAVIEWLKNARFKPAVRKGRTVKNRVVYRVHFDP